MTTPFDRLMTTIRPYLPGAIDDAIRQELFMVCTDFFNRSNAWQEAINFTLAAGADTADVMPFAGRVIQLMHVTIDGRPVRGAYMPEIGTVKMPYPSQQAQTYVATVALNVVDPVTRDAYPIVPYDIVIRFTEELMHGILSRMFAQPNKPWTNLPMAQYYTSKFNGGSARAKNAVAAGNTFGSQRWAYPQAFATTRK
jgi:hypothetical protein